MNRRIIKRLLQRKNLRVILFSSLAIIFLHKHSYVPEISMDHDEMKETSFENSLSWNPVIGQSIGQDGFLPTINKKKKEPPILAQNEIDLRKMEEKLYRYLSKALFMNIPKNLPPYSKIECRPELGLKIPNYVHYVWFGKLKLKLHQYLSMRSAASIQKPTKLFLHLDMDTVPTGPHWERIQKEVSCLEIVRHEPPERIFKHSITYVQHKSDIVRMEVLYKMGGIYLDVNAYVINPMDDLMDNSFVIGKEERGCYGNSVMLAEPGAPFLKLWYESYQGFRPWQWNHHSSHLPASLHSQNPEVEISIDRFSMMRPNYRDGIEWMLVKNWDLTYNYCVHLYENTFELDFAPIFAMSEDEMIKINSTYGQIVRRALYGQFHFEKTKLMKEKAANAVVECDNGPVTSIIPNVLHYIWDRDDFSYYYYLAIRSAASVFKPKSIVFHIIGGEKEREEPFDPLWVRLNHEIPCLQVNRLPEDFMKPKRAIMLDNRPLKMKLELALRYGGTVLDLGCIFTKPFPFSSSSSAVVGMDPEGYSDMFVIGERGSQFLQQWLLLLENQDRNSYDQLQSLAKTSNVQVLRDVIEIAPESWFDSDVADIAGRSASAFYMGYSSILKRDYGEYDVLYKRTTYGQLARFTVFGKQMDSIANM